MFAKKKRKNMAFWKERKEREARISVYINGSRSISPSPVTGCMMEVPRDAALGFFCMNLSKKALGGWGGGGKTKREKQSQSVDYRVKSCYVCCLGS